MSAADAGVGTTVQALSTISASPNPCVVAAGAQSCSSTISWSGDSSSFNYEVLLQKDNLPLSLVGCAASPTTSGSIGVTLEPQHSYRFSLRRGTASCATLDPTATEVAAVTASATTASLNATATNTQFSPYPLLVPSGNLGSTTISWNASYGLNNVVWVSEFNGSTWSAYNNFACNLSTQGTGGSSVAPWIQPGHIYRFSLRPTPTTLPCTTSDSTYPEVASVTVQGYTDYIKALPDRCSTTSTGTCSTTIAWGSAATAAMRKVEVSTNGTTWTQLSCSSASSGTVSSGAMTHDVTYQFRLRPVTSCADTTSAATATTKAYPLSSIVVPVGTGLALAGSPYKAMGMNKFDAFRQYIMKPDYQHALSCSDAPSTSDQTRAEQDMTDAAAKGITFLRVAGIGFYAKSPFTTPPDTQPFELQMWQNCPTTYWQRFDAMLAKAQSLGLKLMVTLVWSQCMFPDLVGEHLGDMVKTPTSQSRTRLMQYVQDLVTRYKDNTTIQGWDLVSELDTLMDLDLSTPSSLCPYTESAADRFTSDDMARFMQTLASSVRGWDPKHLIAGGYTDLRPAQAHLRARPGFATTAYPSGVPDWTQDDKSQFEAFERYINPDPIDVVSLHVYNGDPDGNPATISSPERTNMKFGIAGYYNADILDAYKATADRIGKPLMLGEYNDAWDCGTGCSYPTDYRRNFSRAEIKKILDLHVPLSFEWAWDLRDGPTWYSIQPGLNTLTDEYISLFQTVQSKFNASTASIDVTPTGSGFDTDTDGDGVPDAWWKCHVGVDPGCFGSSFSVSTIPDTYNAKAVRLTTVAGGQGYLTSSVVPLGFVPPSGATLVITAAAKADATISQAYALVYGFTGSNGSGTQTFSMSDTVTGDPGQFKVFLSTAAVPSTTRSIYVQLVANGAGSVEFDDLRLSVVY